MSELNKEDLNNDTQPVLPSSNDDTHEIKDSVNQSAGNMDSAEDEARYYTYESSEFEGSNAQSKPVKRGFLRKVTATVGFAITFGIIAGVCLHFTGKFLDDSTEKTEITIGGSNSTVSGAQALSTTPVLSTDMQIKSDVSAVAQAVMPSVVAITETSVQSVGGWYGLMEQEVEGSGSGIIIKEDDDNLYIVTNNHVISGAETIEVTFIDETTASAEVKGAVESEDVAVITVKKSDLSEDTLNNIKIASVGDSDDVKVGQTAIAIGNALGYGQSVTAGVISAKDREISVSSSDNTITITVLQTDAAINPGNSGGALLNEAGEVIGINSAKLASSQVEGMGYAIPISNVMSIINDIIDKEVLAEDEQGYLGIIAATITESQQQYYGLPEGVYIKSISEDGPAERAGLLNGDIITGINDMEIDNMQDLSSQIKSYRVGTTVTIKYKRIKNGEYKEYTVDVVLEALPDELKTSADSTDDDADDSVNENNNSDGSGDDQNQYQEPRYVYPYNK